MKGRSSTILSYNDAQTVVQELGIESYTHYNKLFSAKKLPKGLPSDPSSFYSRKGRVGRGGSKAKKFIEYDIVKQWAQDNKIKSMREYVRTPKPKGFPKSPDCCFQYRDQWEGWEIFLNTNPLSYKESQKLVIPYKFKSYSDYTKNVRKYKELNKLLKQPQRYYKNKGWINWNHFLTGNKNSKWDSGIVKKIIVKKVKKREIMSFEEHKKTVRRYKITSFKQLLEAKKSGLLPKSFSVNVRRMYKKEWRTYYDFFGTKKIKFLTFEQARKLIIKHKVTSQIQFFELKGKGILPKTMPSSPLKQYKKHWSELLYKDEFTYKQASDWCRQNDIQTSGEFHAFKNKPKGLTRNPRIFFKKEWKGWHSFLQREELMTFEEASDYCKKIGIKTALQFSELRRKGKLPSNMPRNPDKYFSKNQNERETMSCYRRGTK
ncbi:MAG: hypothetical protein KJI69_03540 [Patescibacteria group bacterium]|nr:hypothetical protein [Patescibacteria group bacterium]